MSKNDGGPAFPGVSADGRDENQGMSLRDYFAAKAMAAMALADADNGVLRDDHTAQRTADYAYRLADAMLAERAK